MRRNQALPSKYLKKEDFEKPALCVIDTVTSEDVDGDDGKERKPVLYFASSSNPEQDLHRGLIVNATNWDTVSEIMGEDPNATDTDDWKGLEVVVFNDPDVRFGGKKIGGIRVRAPQKKSAPEPDPEPAPAEPEVANDDLPF